jgi:hypothetical protein
MRFLWSNEYAKEIHGTYRYLWRILAVGVQNCAFELQTRRSTAKVRQAGHSDGQQANQSMIGLDHL